jgi:hypothetical protein
MVTGHLVFYLRSRTYGEDIDLAFKDNCTRRILPLTMGQFALKLGVVSPKKCYNRCGNIVMS